MAEMRTKIVGVSWENRQDYVKELVPEQQVFLVREEDNPFDPHALAVFADESCKKKLGYLGKDLAHDIVAQMSKGWKYEVFVTQVTGDEKRTHGVNIRIVANIDLTKR